MKWFNMTELTGSYTAARHGIDNSPTPEIEKNLNLLVARVLDIVREYYGFPIKVSSGYRCPELNKLVGGAANSHHMRGMAADITVGSMADNRKLYELIKSLNLDLCQCILEKGGKWIHISYDENDIRNQYLEL